MQVEGKVSVRYGLVPRELLQRKFMTQAQLEVRVLKLYFAVIREGQGHVTVYREKLFSRRIRLGCGLGQDSGSGVLWSLSLGSS